MFERFSSGRIRSRAACSKDGLSPSFRRPTTRPFALAQRQRVGRTPFPGRPKSPSQNLPSALRSSQAIYPAIWPRQSERQYLPRRFRPQVASRAKRGNDGILRLKVFEAKPVQRIRKRGPNSNLLRVDADIAQTAPVSTPELNWWIKNASLGDCGSSFTESYLSRNEPRLLVFRESSAPRAQTLPAITTVGVIILGM